MDTTDLHLNNFEVNGITYVHPLFTSSVYVRPIFQFYEIDERLCAMRVENNTPKAGLMDSEVDEEWLKEYWDS